MNKIGLVEQIKWKYQQEKFNAGCYTKIIRNHHYCFVSNNQVLTGLSHSAMVQALSRSFDIRVFPSFPKEYPLPSDNELHQVRQMHADRVNQKPNFLHPY